MARIARSVVHSSLASFGSLAISLALVIVVSRLLTPAEIGAFLLAFAVLMFVEPLRELQLKSYLLLKDEIGTEELAPSRFVAILNTLLAIAACAMIALALHQGFEAPAVGNCLLIMALGLVGRPWSQLAEAVLAKQYRYGAIAWVKLGAVTAKVAVTLLLISQGWAAEALAWGIVAEFAFELIFVLLIDPALRFVGPRMTGAREVYRFCSQYGGAQLLGGLGASAEPLMIGSFQGLAWTAFFNRANRLVRVLRSGVEQAINPIALTALSEADGDRTRLRSDYLRTITLLTGAVWPALAALVVLAEPVILGLFGPQWTASVQLAQILAVGGMVHAATALSQPLHAAAGEAGLVFRREVALTVLRIIILAVTVTISTTAVALGLLAMLVVSFFVNQVLLSRSFGISPMAFVGGVWRSAAAAVMVALVSHLALSIVTWGDGPAAKLAVLAPIAAISALISLAALRHPLAAEARALIGVGSARSS